MSGPHDFDFLHGDWEVRHRRRTDFLDPGGDWEEFPATTRCLPFFDGAANVDEIDMPYLGTRGLTLRLFDRESGQWSLNWASSGSGRLFPPVIGGFDGTDGTGDEDGSDGSDGTGDEEGSAEKKGVLQQGGIRGEFYGDDTHDGKDVRVRFVWSGISATTARWEQAFSTDGGETWLTNWVMDFTRLRPGPPSGPSASGTPAG
ncbi:hypothetical protein OG562_35635 [Streptomyces sp. NBC_01275]|uniref:hypothetical protein n=1 Tax=Streptomyces sp. NBC_01275 TaxID=2903807 RepID=UPI00225B3984|nr:hypothetical protein [Streptomyces sp. NBC_01275]MCX4766220.1 hypothetical protein [Streptomyces sp. NBC_01275]